MINVYKSSPAADFIEQPGDGRTWNLSAGPGRLDTVDCAFILQQSSTNAPSNPDRLKALAEQYFRPFTEHPSLRGFYVVPGSARAIQAWHGLARVGVTYAGMANFPKLPDAYVEATSGQEAQVFSEGIASAAIVYDLQYIVSVHHSATTPNFSSLLHRLYRLDGVGPSPATNPLAILKTELLEEAGPYKILRHHFYPKFIASISLKLAIGSDGNIIFPDTAGAPRRVALTGCTVGDDFWRRLSGGGR